MFVGDITADTVTEYTSTGTLRAVFGASGTGDGQFQGVYDIAFDSSGNLFSTDLTIERVTKFTKTGHTSGSLDGYFLTPEGIDINEAGTAIYVLDQATLG